jgi:long-chain acyl-CoA synthetase
MSLNLASIVANGSTCFADETALIHPDFRLSYRGLGDAVRRFASALADVGVRPGDKVALMAPNRPEFTIAYYGILHAGATVVPLNILLVADEVAYTLSDSDAAAMVVWAPLEAGVRGFESVEACRTLFVAGAGGAGSLRLGAIRFEQAIERAGGLPETYATAAEDTAVILYTSGTTGRPKGAELTHLNLWLNALCVSERQFCRWPQQVAVMGPGHVGLAVLPLYHSFGQTAIQNGMLFGGAAIRYVERFDAETALAAIANDHVTFFAGVPTMYFAILAVPDAEKRFDLSSLRFCVSGGAALPVEVKRAFESRFGVRIQEAYGLSETSPLACSQEVHRTDKAGSIGRPIWGVEMMIGDDSADVKSQISDLKSAIPKPVAIGETGEVLIRGHNIMKGYYKNPDATAEAMRGGWFHSGDIGRQDDDGDFYIVDRLKDLIIRGGYNVYPREVEEVLYQHPAVREAAVVGVPDPKYGEEVKAVIALRAGTTATPDEITAYCKERMAAYKYPRVVQIIDSLPKGPTGKILRRELRT